MNAVSPIRAWYRRLLNTLTQVVRHDDEVVTQDVIGSQDLDAAIHKGRFHEDMRE